MAHQYCISTSFETVSRKVETGSTYLAYLVYECVSPLTSHRFCWINSNFNINYWPKHFYTSRRIVYSWKNSKPRTWLASYESLSTFWRHAGHFTSKKCSNLPYECLSQTSDFTLVEQMLRCSIEEFQWVILTACTQSVTGWSINFCNNNGPFRFKNHLDFMPIICLDMYPMMLKCNKEHSKL